MWARSQTSGLISGSTWRSRSAVDRCATRSNVRCRVAARSSAMVATAVGTRSSLTFPRHVTNHGAPALEAVAPCGPVQPRFFATPAEFRAWLAEHHETETELLVGFHKKGSGRPSITWPESVDEALCFGWIDGVRRRIDDEAYSIRFTPRKAHSMWSAINIKRVAELIEDGLMRPAGLAAFERRSEERSGIYSYEQRKAARFDADQEREFRANEAAW